MSLYWWILLGSMAGPLLLSFDKKVRFFSYWKALFPAILIVAAGFLCWDEYFARLEIWGFTPAHLGGVYFGRLPLEECLFFLVVPYACMFVYEVIKAYFPKRKTAVFARIFGFLMVFSGMYLGITYLDNWYTASACVLSSMLILGLYFVGKAPWFGDFALMFSVVLLPFLAVNGFLTGMFTGEPVVWYDPGHIIGFPYRHDSAGRYLLQPLHAASRCCNLRMAENKAAAQVIEVFKGRKLSASRQLTFALFAPLR